MSQLEKYFSYQALDDNLNRLLKGHFDVIGDGPKVSTGADRIDLRLFLRDRELHLHTIERKVLEGRYTFKAFLECKIPKDGTKELRTISVASIRDSVVQRALYEYLYEPVENQLYKSVVFGYRKGVSAHDAVRLIQQHFKNGRVCVFEADLQKFFDNVDHETLLARVAELDLDERAFTLIRRFLKTGKVPTEEVQRHRQLKGKQQKYVPQKRVLGVPQGGVLSGMLTNLYLAEFDAGMMQSHPGLVRYADDFLVCCESEAECHDAHARAKLLLEPLKVSLHPSDKKTKPFIHATSGVDFLGFRLKPNSTKVRGKNISKFKARVQGVIASQKKLKTSKGTLRNLCYRLSFKIRGPNQLQLKKLAEQGGYVALCRRSWIGYFRIIDDVQQVRQLDRWIRAQVSKYMWDTFQKSVQLKQ